MDELQRLTNGKIPGEATGIEVRKSICTICDPATQCGLDCYVKDGRIIKVEGSKENPNSAGTLCAKGAAQRQWVHNDDRLRTPLKRSGPRGSGEMVPISWSEALDTIAENLQKAKAESGPESVVFYAGYPKHMRPWLQRLALQFGSAQLLHRVQHLPRAHGHGVASPVRAVRRTRLGKREVRAGLDGQFDARPLPRSRAD